MDIRRIPFLIPILVITAADEWHEIPFDLDLRLVEDRCGSLFSLYQVTRKNVGGIVDLHREMKFRLRIGWSCLRRNFQGIEQDTQKGTNSNQIHTSAGEAAKLPAQAGSD